MEVPHNEIRRTLMIAVMLGRWCDGCQLIGE